MNSDRKLSGLVDAVVDAPASRPIDARSLPIKRFLDGCLTSYADNQDGTIADYIPELSKADPAHFGVAVTTIDGHTHEIGNSQVPFTIQSVSKAFVFGLAIEFCGQQTVANAIGVEPSGDAFNSIRLSADNRPFNPMVNAGAIACSGLIHAADPKHAFARIQETLSRFAGRDLAVDEPVYESEKATGDRNRAIAWLLRNNDVLKGDVDQALDVYFRQCALLVSASDLSVMGATLANNGVNPVTGEAVISPLASARVLSVMVSSGMYDYSGEWIYRVGLPAKSGVGGGIVAALPAQIGLGTYSPKLDALGNSVRGLQVCEHFSSYFGLHLLERQGDVKSSIAASYHLGEIHSHRDRCPADQQILEQHGHSVGVIELAGALNFVACDYISRQLNDAPSREIQIFEFRRVAGISSAAAKLLASTFLNLRENGTRIVLTGLVTNSLPAKILADALKDGEDGAVRGFDTLNDATAWAEDQVIYVHGGFETMRRDIDLSAQALLSGLDAQQFDILRAKLQQQEYRGGAKIIESGLLGDSLYFLVGGMVSVVLSSGVRVATLDAGTCFGELVLISPEQPRAADIVTDAPSRCFRLSVSDFDALKAEHPGIAEVILRNVGRLLAERLRHANAKIDALSH